MYENPLYITLRSTVAGCEYKQKNSCSFEWNLMFHEAHSWTMSRSVRISSLSMLLKFIGSFASLSSAFTRDGRVSGAILQPAFIEALLGSVFDRNRDIDHGDLALAISRSERDTTFARACDIPQCCEAENRIFLKIDSIKNKSLLIFINIDYRIPHFATLFTTLITH